MGFNSPPALRKGSFIFVHCPAVSEVSPNHQVPAIAFAASVYT